MKRWYRTAGLAVFFLAITVSCRQLYTTSLGEGFSRSYIYIPDDTPLDKLLDISATTGATDPDVAKELLYVLAGKTADELNGLSARDKETVLNLATTAAIDMDALTGLAKDATAAGADTDRLVEDIFSSFDTSVDLTAIEVLLSDTGAAGAVATAPVETVILAAAAVLADAADFAGSNTVMNILGNASPLTSPEFLALPMEQQAQLELVVNVRTALTARIAANPETETDIAGFNLTDLLEGTQP